MIGLDAYDRGARLAPAYLVFSPAVVLVLAASLGTPEWWSKFGGVLVACGAPILAVQWGRAGGRKKQEALFAEWDGAPTTRLLRFRTGGSTAAVAQRHASLERSTGISLPSQADEVNDPEAADAVYVTAVTALRELTRDEKQFPLVLKENIAYGFRRNLWGRKAYGVWTSILVALVSGAFLAADFLGHDLVAAPSAAAGAAFAVLALVVWIWMVTPEWVHEAAHAYAERLLDSALRLPPTQR